MNIKTIEKAIEDSDLGEDCQGNRLYLEITSDMVDWLVSTHRSMNEELETAEDAVAVLMHKIESMIPSLDLLQTRLEQGADIEYQDDEWQLFAKDGNGLCHGKTIRDMLINLILMDG